MKKLLLLTLFVPAVAFARDPPPGTNTGKVTYEKKTVINFEDDTIQGDLTKPDGEYVESRKKVKHSNLIKIREEFKDKVLQSAGEL
jgi:pyruvate/2-oxoglutarate dehydrogenase complex dihydrolipoamide acyltransferase (E2) component